MDMTDVIVHTKEPVMPSDLSPGSRIYLVKLLDPVARLVHTAATVIPLDEALDIDAKAGLLGMPFAQALMHSAAGRVAMQVENSLCGPEEFEIQFVTEISARELLGYVEQSKATRAAMTAGSS